MAAAAAAAAVVRGTGEASWGAGSEEEGAGKCRGEGRQPPPPLSRGASVFIHSLSVNRAPGGPARKETGLCPPELKGWRGVRYWKGSNSGGCCCSSGRGQVPGDPPEELTGLWGRHPGDTISFLIGKQREGKVSSRGKRTCKGLAASELGWSAGMRCGDSEARGTTVSRGDTERLKPWRDVGFRKWQTGAAWGSG